MLRILEPGGCVGFPDSRGRVGEVIAVRRTVHDLDARGLTGVGNLGNHADMTNHPVGNGPLTLKGMGHDEHTRSGGGVLQEPSTRGFEHGIGVNVPIIQRKPTWRIRGAGGNVAVKSASPRRKPYTIGHLGQLGL